LYRSPELIGTPDPVKNGVITRNLKKNTKQKNKNKIKKENFKRK